MGEKRKENVLGIEIAGIPVGLYIIMFVIIVAGTCKGLIPNNFLTGFAFCMIIGCVLTWIGKRNKYFNMLGGPSLLCLFVPTLLVFAGILPSSVVDFTKEFYTGSMGYIDFFIASLISGSILSMDRKILINAGSRYAIPIVCGVVLSFVGAGLIGIVTGYGFGQAILNLAIPIMGGGIGAGAIPIASIYEGYGYSISGGDVLSMLMPAVTMANIMAILLAAVLNAMGQSKKAPSGFSGAGVLMQTGEIYEVKEGDKKAGATFVNLGIGLLMAGTLYIFGYLCSKLIFSGIHAYAWTILTAAILKITGIVPKKVEEAAGDWYELISYIGVPTILVCVSLTSMDIPTIIGAMSNPVYFLITFAVTAFAAVGAGIGGRLSKMYFVESSITAGLCMANAGGAGDVAVLGASERMNLMPFAQISSRIGGALILLIASFLTPFLF